MERKANLPRILFNIFNYLFFILLILLCLYPLWYIFILSISSTDDVSILPKGVTINNFVQVFQIRGIYHAFLISVLRTVVGTLSTVMTCTLLGYLFSKRELPHRSFFYRMFIVTMYVTGGLIPTYLVMNAYGLLNTFAVYILPNVISPYYIMLIKTYVEQMPSELEESARIDGASTMVVFFHIIFPLAVPIVATISVYAAVFQWNSWFDNHIYTFNREGLTTIQYMLYTYLQRVEVLMQQLEDAPTAGLSSVNVLTPKGVRMTVTMITVLPILFVYPFMQRYFVKGIMLGAVKG